MDNEDFGTVCWVRTLFPLAGRLQLITTAPLPVQTAVQWTLSNGRSSTTGTEVAALRSNK